ncbi:MAG: hypothetical protein R6U32_05225 [Candidatus Woesearchaeota archaeon]
MADDDPETLYKGIKTRYAVYIIFAVLLMMGLFILMDSMKMPSTYAVYNPGMTDNYISNPDDLKARYNQNTGSIPSFIRLMFGDERLNTTLARLEGSEVQLAVETDNGKIKSIKRGEMKDPTMQLHIEESAVRDIIESDSSVDELEQALEDGRIEYENERFFTSLKMGALSATVNVASWFS